MGQSKNLRAPLINIKDVIDFFAQENANVTLIQVGANDGKNNDPVYSYITKYQWNSVLLEPQTWVFENELKQTYAGFDNVRMENKAIASDEEDLTFYQLGFTNARWATGLAGFDKKSLQAHIDSGYVDRKAQQSGVTLPEKKEDYIVENKVATTSFDALIERNKLEKVDFICIDTEGFDYEILRQFNFAKFRPSMVLFESKNLSDCDFKAAKHLLLENGYKLYWQKGDTLAIQFHLPWMMKLRSKFRAFRQKI